MSEGDDASTPLDSNEATGLRLAYVSTRAELNEAEALNIEAGLRWAGRGRSLDEVLDASFLRELHRRMFGDVWGWAGCYRRTEKNLGIDWWHIPVAVDELVRDAAAWCTAGPSGWSIDEIGARFHHRLVSIHPFPNGNGRMSRAAADLIVVALGAAPFTWGRLSAREPGAAPMSIHSSQASALVAQRTRASDSCQEVGIRTIPPQGSRRLVTARRC